MTQPRFRIPILSLCLASLSVLIMGCQTSKTIRTEDTNVRKARSLPKPAFVKPIQPNPIRREIQGELQNLTTAQATAPTPETTSPPAPVDSTTAEKTIAANTSATNANTNAASTPSTSERPGEPLKRLDLLEVSRLELSKATDTPLIFDIPVTYNARVRHWIRFFQTTGRTTFKNWLQRSARYLPLIQYELSEAGLPQDLVYVPMIESGFVSHALSHAGAKGMWQFIAPTAERYGLKIDWWIDERRDFLKSTRAAIRYMTDLYRQFGSWYLVAASYNMGENGVRRLIKRHGTSSFWELADRGALPRETRDYVPKIIASILISKAPALYGFRDLEYQMPLSYETVQVPGGTDIVNLATYLGVSEKYLKGLNPELLKGFIPSEIQSHEIRVPKGAVMAVSQFVRLQARNNETTTAAN